MTPAVPGRVPATAGAVGAAPCNPKAAPAERQEESLIEPTMQPLPGDASSDLSWPDVLACERAVLRFTAAFDASDLDGMLAEFASDGVWRRMEGTVRGHDGLRALMAARPPGLLVRHVITNMRVVLAGPGSAACTSYVTVYRHDHGGAKPAPLGQPALVGVYHDVLNKTEQTWLLSGRSVSVDFKQT